MESKNFDNIYQKGFKDGYEMAMKMLNNMSLNNNLSHNNSSQKSDNNYQKNLNDNNNLNYYLNDNILQLEQNKKIKKNKLKYDELEEYVEHFTINLQPEKTIEDIISLITKYLNKINEKKLLILLNGNLDNYVFLNKDYKFNNIKYLSKFISNRFKLSMNIDLYININLNYNKKEYHIVVDKFKNPSVKSEKIILIQ